jgi:hypothetical protein
LPHALGNAAAIYLFCPAGFVMPRICEDKSNEHKAHQTPKKHVIYNSAYELNPYSLSLSSGIMFM